MSCRIELDRRNFKFNDHNRSISYDLILSGRLHGQPRVRRPAIEFLDKKEYFIRKLKGK